MYAWIMQIAISNRIYPKVTIKRIIVALTLLNHAAEQYTPTRLSTMCPALIFAASRNDSVRGRTKILVVSISTKNGLSQSGAPSGKKWAIDDLGAFENLDKIILSHRGRPKDRVKIKCLVVLNKYGTNPNRFVIMIIINKGAIIELNPFRCFVNVRISWSIIKEVKGFISATFRLAVIQNLDWIRRMIKMFTRRKILVDGI